MKFVRISNSPVQTLKIARELAADLKPGDVIALIGELGAGKTVFVRGLMSGLKIRARCLSPSFLLCRRLKSGKKFFYHLDLYRNKTDEIFNRETYQNVLQEKAIAAVEWAQKSRFWQKYSTIKIILEYLSREKMSRKITIIKKNEYSGN